MSRPFTSRDTLSVSQHPPPNCVEKYRTEYMVHGLFGKLGTENGFYGAYWMPVRRVAGDVGRVALELELEIFEQQQSDWRTEDLDKWEEEEAEEETE